MSRQARAPRWLGGIAILALTATFSGCQELPPSPQTGACEFVDDNVFTEITGETGWMASEDEIESDDDSTQARCGITADDQSSSGSIQIKSSHPAEPAVIEENIRQQLEDPDFTDRLVQPCTDYEGDPGVGIGCESTYSGDRPDDSYVYVHSEDTSISVVLAGWPEGSTSKERLEIAEDITRDFLEGFAEYREANSDDQT